MPRRARPLGLSVGAVVALLGIGIGAANEIGGVTNPPTWLAVLLIVMGALVAIAAEISSRIARRHEEDRHVAALLRGGRPPDLARDADPFDAGVTRSRLAEQLALNSNRAEPPYVRRVVDAALDAALVNSRFVILTGRSKAGKSRSALEAVKRARGDARLLIPASTAAVGELLTLEVAKDTAVVLWLDDLQDYLDSGAVDTGKLGLFLANPRAAVIATIRTSERDRFSADSSPIARDARDVLHLGSNIHLDFGLQEEEVSEATSLYPGGDFSESIGGFFTAVDELLRKLEQGQVSNPVGYALVHAAIDWRRVGFTRGAALTELQNLLPLYVPGALLSESALTSAAEWANEPVSSGARLLSAVAGPDGSNRFTAADPLIDHEDGVRDVPVDAWRAVLAFCSPEEAADIMIPAQTRGHVDFAKEAGEKALRIVDKKSRLLAQTRLATIYHFNGELAEAERLYREPAEAGHIAALVNLGSLLRASEPDEAERLLLRAADQGDPLGKSNLANLYISQGRFAAARDLAEEAVQDGTHYPSFVQLAQLIEDSDPDRAESLLRRAVELADADETPRFATETRPKFALGRFLLLSDPEESGQLLEECANNGDANAAFFRGLLFKEAGNRDESLVWFQKAADAGDTGGEFELGLYYTEQGDDVQAEHWFRKAAQGEGLPADAAAGWLASLLFRGGRTDEAELFATQAANADDPTGLYYLAETMRLRGDINGALEIWRSGAAKGDTRCAHRLGFEFHQRGDLKAAAEWYRKAADGGSDEAAYNLATVLLEFGQFDDALEQFEAAGSAGTLAGPAQTVWGLILFGRGDTDGARAELSAAAAVGAPNAQKSLDVLFGDDESGAGGHERLQARAALGDDEAVFSLAMIALSRREFVTTKYWLDVNRQKFAALVGLTIPR